MIVMRFTIELDTGLPFLLQFAPPLASDRSRDENSSSWALQAIVASVWEQSLHRPHGSRFGRKAAVPPQWPRLPDGRATSYCHSRPE
jgi:hypothetical protein